MSSTGRGPRLGGPDDFYETPAWVVDRLLERWTPPIAPLLEPAAGAGAIIRAVQAHRIDDPWFAVECRATAAADLMQTGAKVEIADFLAWEPQGDARAVGCVITNPPFKDCEAFIRHARKLYPVAELVFLVRLGFLSSEGRVALWDELGAPDVYVLPNRPSFTPNGATDSADYAWIVLPRTGPRDHGELRILATTPAAERRPRRGQRVG